MLDLCLLQVRLYAAPTQQLAADWEQVADVSDMHRTHMQATNWKASACADLSFIGVSLCMMI
jgi:hypothetical protein